MNKQTLVLISAIAGPVLLFASAAVAFLRPDMPLAWQVTLGLAVVAIITYVVLERGAIAATLAKRTTRYGINSVFMSFVALLIAIFVNLIVAEHDFKKDFTKNKLHTLSDQSVKLLKGLKSEVKFRAFVAPNQVPDFQKIFEKYTYYSNMVKPEFVDVDKEPFAVQKYNIKQPGTVIVETENRTAKVDNLMGPDDPKVEEKLTNAIIQATKGSKRKVYFLTGHGERLIGDTQREGFSEIKDSLQEGRYEVAELAIVNQDIPADAEILIVAAPKADFMEHELKALETYLRKGGKALFMMEPVSTPTLKPFLDKFGADWRPKKTVLETNRLQQLAGGNPLTPIVTTYDGAHQITQEAKQMSIFPIATPVEKAGNAPTNFTIASLFSTSNRSFEVELKGDRVMVDEKKDRKGPISLALAVSGKAEGAPKVEDPAEKDKPADPTKPPEEKKELEFRLVVVGDADFASNGVLRNGINADLFQNMMSWLSKEEDLISIRPRPTDTSEFEITETRARVIFLASVAVLPLGMFLSGFAVWLSRRRR